MYLKYSKSYNNMFTFKRDLLDNNDERVKRKNEVRDIYKAQKMRTGCKLCGVMNKRWSFHAHGVEYFICDNCGHLNGIYCDSDEYCKSLYESGGDYAKDYDENDPVRFMQRVDTIYSPKVSFMTEGLKEERESNATYRVLDVGAGSGFFVKALLDAGYSAKGIDVDELQIKHAREMLGDETMAHVPSADVPEYIENANVDVITFIYSLEHVVNLKEILDAINKNDHIQYVFFSVPMFSFSVVISSLFDDVLDRVLGGGEHTHLYTQESIEWICKEYSWEKIAAWHFGADAADLVRTVQVKLLKAGNRELAECFSEKAKLIMDEIQSVLDKSDFCSDIHVMLKKNIKDMVQE